MSTSTPTSRVKATTTARVAATAARVVVTVIILALLFFGYGQYAAFLAVAMLCLRSLRRPTPHSLAHAGTLLAVVMVMWFEFPQKLAQVFPLLISLSFMFVFWASLSQPETLLEVYTAKVKKLDDDERVFLRMMTKMWVGFCAVNSLLIAFCTFFYRDMISEFYATMLSYVFLVVMILITIIIGVVRRHRKGLLRWGEPRL